MADPTDGVCGCAKQSIDFTETWKAKVAIVSVRVATVSVAIASVAIVSVAIVSADVWKVNVFAAFLHVPRMCAACTLHAHYEYDLCIALHSSSVLIHACNCKVIADTGDHYLKPNAPEGLVQGGGLHHAKRTRPKLTIRGVAN